MSPHYVLDASALLAALHEEPGSDAVLPHIGTSVISSVNWSEVIQKSLSRGVNVTGLRADLEMLGLTVMPFTAEDGEVAAGFWMLTRRHGLSIADRACLAVGSRLQLPVLTADRAWKNIQVGVTIRVVRP